MLTADAWLVSDVEKIWIIYNETLTGDSFKRQRDSYKESIKRAGYVPEEVTVYGALKREDTPFFALFTDKDIYAAQKLENRGIRLFNNSECIRLCDDKALTYIRLEKFNVPIPETVIPPKIYYGNTDRKICREAAENLGYPLIVKECFGSFGKQVYMVRGEEELFELTEKLGAKPYVFQRFIAKSKGFDIRVIVSAGEAVGAVKRVNDKDFRSNVENGGRTEKYIISEEEKALAVLAAKAVGADFAGVDLLEDEDGFKVCEVNSNFHFYGAQKHFSICISDRIIDDLIFYSINK